MGFSIPILNPTKEEMSTDEGDGMGNGKGGKGDKLVAQLVYIFFSQYIFGPHTHVHMNYDIFNIFNKRIFEQYL